MNAAIDIGTSAVKGACFDASGAVVAHGTEPLPSPVRDGICVTQDLAAILTAADRVRDAISAGATALAVTTQRDTAVLDGVLVSWMDGRAATHGSLWAPLDPTGRPVRSLASAVLEHWTGTAAETEESLSIHLRDETLEARGCDVPRVVEMGLPAGAWNSLPVYPTAGDKNCALLGNGASETVAGLSLGSAVSLGLLATGTPEAQPGIFLSRAAIPGRWNVETGLIAGMSARPALARWLPVDRVPGDFVEDLWMLPHFAGALDRPATGAIVGLTTDTSALQIAAAWSQGVVAELVRLRPVLEATAGSRIERIRISGGGAQPGWDALVADAFEVPVERVHGTFAGCRGAVDAIRLAHGLPRLPIPALSTQLTLPEHPERFARWTARYVDLFGRLTD